MSTIKHPVGPQPDKIYWRRRLLVILGVVAVIVVIALILVRPGASKGETPAPGAVGTQSPAPKSGSKPDATTIPTTAASVAGAACKPANIVVTAITDATSYAPDQQPKLSLSLTNTGSASCTIDAGTATQVYTITSGTEVYWKSTDCQTNPVHTEVLLKPDKTITSTPIIWDRTRSDPSTCDSTRTPVPAGGASYHVKTAVGGIASNTTQQFLLN